MDGVAGVGRMPIPKPLPGFIYGERRWRSVADNVIYTWDALHGEIEAYDSRRQYLGMSDDEYAVWLMSHGALPSILAARRGRRPLAEVVLDYLAELERNHPFDRPAIAALSHWLRRGPD